MHALRNPAPLRITTVMLKLARSRLLLLRERMMLMIVVMEAATHGYADDVLGCVLGCAGLRSWRSAPWDTQMPQ